MKCKVVTEVDKNKVPEVGELWHHPSYEETYMRIQDAEGAKALSLNNTETLFFSVSMRDGKINSTIKSQGDVVILEPDGGVLVLVEKR